jgi:hypothetical protein
MPKKAGEGRKIAARGERTRFFKGGLILNTEITEISQRATEERKMNAFSLESLCSPWLCV